MLQHAWAAISHKLDYKSTSQAPAELRRQLFRLSALLELADDEFKQIRERSQKIVERYREEVDKGELNIPLNIDSLSEFVRERIDKEEWYTLGREAGMAKDEDPEPHEAVVDRLFVTLQALGVKTLAELENLLNKYKPTAKDTLTLIAKSVQKHGGEFTSVPVDNINVLLAVSERKRIRRDLFFAEVWRDEINDALAELLPSNDSR